MTMDRKNIRGIIIILFSTITFFFLLWKYSAVIQVLRNILSILSPIILGLCIAFLTAPLLRAFESFFRHMRKKPETRGSRSTCRALGIVFVFVVVFGVLTILMSIIMPEVSATISGFISSLPDYAERLSAWVFTLPESFSFIKELFLEQPDWDKVVSTLTAFFTEGAGGTMVTGVLGATASILGGLWNVIFGLIISIYVLSQKEKIGRVCTRTVKAFLPERRVKRLFYVTRLANNAFSSFVTGQLIEALVIGVLCYVGMLIFGFPFALTIGTIVAFTALIPVFGAWIGAILGALLILTVEPIRALWFLVFLVILQQLEGNLIYPKVVGKTVGLPGLLVMLAVWIGGSLTGVLGMLLAVPLCSVLYTLLKEAISARLDKPQPQPAAE